MELTFRSDTKHRKQYFTGMSFSHPAKLVLPLQLWLIDKYTKPGELILDPMAGSGTILVACMMGRHVVTVELEEKFVAMQKGNWEKIKQRGPMMGYEMGQATILQGDARYMRGILADKIITSPPYYSLRDYQVTGQMGLEPTLTAYLDGMTTLFSEVRRGLREDGVMWLNMGASYAGSIMVNNDEPYALRNDLTPDEVAYVMSELATFIQGDKITNPNVPISID